MITLPQVNKALTPLGDIQLVKGGGYFYFVGESVSVDAGGVYVNRLSQLTLPEWVAEAESVIQI